MPYPVLLLIFGLLLAFVPGLPLPSVNPELLLPSGSAAAAVRCGPQDLMAPIPGQPQADRSACGRVGGGDGLRGRVDPAEHSFRVCP